jgi:hypothetical protein
MVLMALNNDPQSRFKLTQEVVRNNIETFGLLTKHAFLDPNLPEADIIRITVSPAQAGRPWLIASDIYNSPFLDWVIVLFNRPINPVNWPAVGTVIKAPRATIVLPNV